MASEASWLNAREAAALLGVKRATLYAYKSRGWVVSVPGPGGRGRRYARESLERLKARHDARAGHGAVAAGALRFGEPTLETSVSEIRADGPYYRGHAAVSLCEQGVVFEAICDLLLEGRLDTAPGWSKRTRLLQLKAADGPRKDLEPCQRLAALVSGIGSQLPTRYGLAEREEHRRARELLCFLADRAGSPARRHRAGQRIGGSIAERVLVSFGVRTSSRHCEVVDRALGLCADHELNASTFVARVAASTGADLYACIAAALHTLSGPKHGGASARVEALLREIPQPSAAARVMRERLSRGESLPGFGHPLYPTGDPRAKLLLELAESLVVHRSARVHADYAKLRALHVAVERASYQPPNLDFGLVAVSTALGLARGSAVALFAIGRVPGWAAHALEQRGQHYILRPRARYVPTPA